MSLSNRRVCLMAGAFVVGASASTAHAEPFIDIFAGKSWTTRTDLALRAERPSIDGTGVPIGVRVDIDGLKPRNSETFGARIGFWNGILGFAIDGSTFDPTMRPRTVRASASVSFDETIFGRPVSIGGGQGVSVALPQLPLPTTVTLAGLAMVRLPIFKSDRRQQGIVQPYGFAGPVWLVTNDRFNGKIGIRAGGGVKLPLGNNLGLFAEYRYTAVNDADVKAGRLRASSGGVNASTGDIIGRIDIRTHAGVAGVSLSF